MGHLVPGGIAGRRKAPVRFTLCVRQVVGVCRSRESVVVLTTVSTLRARYCRTAVSTLGAIFCRAPDGSPPEREYYWSDARHTPTHHQTRIPPAGEVRAMPLRTGPAGGVRTTWRGPGGRPCVGRISSSLVGLVVGFGFGFVGLVVRLALGGHLLPVGPVVCLVLGGYLPLVGPVVCLVPGGHLCLVGLAVDFGFGGQTFLVGLVVGFGSGGHLCFVGPVVGFGFGLVGLVVGFGFGLVGLVVCLVPGGRLCLAGLVACFGPSCSRRRYAIPGERLSAGSAGCSVSRAGNRLWPPPTRSALSCSCRRCRTAGRWRVCRMLAVRRIRCSRFLGWFLRWLLGGFLGLFLFWFLVGSCVGSCSGS